MNEKLLSIGETAKLLDVCENTLRDWDIEGKFKAERSAGGHRRYSLDQVREYLEKNPPKVEEKPQETYAVKNDVIWSNWVNTEYFKDCKTLTLREQENLALILENVKLSNDNSSNPLFSTSQILWLIQQAWLRTKFKKMVSIQPITSPASLIFYLDGKKNSVDSEAICAKTYKYSFSFFEKAEFDKIKDSYADAIAYDIDCAIMDLLPTINVEWISDAATMLPTNRIRLADYYDYVILPKWYAEKAKELGMTYGLDVFEGPLRLDEESLLPKAIGGRYPKSQFNLEPPIFAPYIMLIDGPSLGSTRTAMFRAGTFKPKDSQLI